MVKMSKNALVFSMIATFGFSAHMQASAGKGEPRDLSNATFSQVLCMAAKNSAECIATDAAETAVAAILFQEVQSFANHHTLVNPVNLKNHTVGDLSAGSIVCGALLLRAAKITVNFAKIQASKVRVALPRKN